MMLSCVVRSCFIFVVYLFNIFHSFIHSFTRFISDIVKSHVLQSDDTSAMLGFSMKVPCTVVEGASGGFEIDVSISHLVWIWTIGRGGEDEIGWMVCWLEWLCAGRS
jgi:hypothetical protein